MRLIGSLLTLALVGGGGWWLWNNNPDVRQFVNHHIDTGDFQTLEIRYTPSQIMEKSCSGERTTPSLSPSPSFILT
jgi:hypothetical protein